MRDLHRDLVELDRLSAILLRPPALELPLAELLDDLPLLGGLGEHGPRLVNLLLRDGHALHDFDGAALHGREEATVGGEERHVELPDEAVVAHVVAGRLHALVEPLELLLELRDVRLPLGELALAQALLVQALLEDSRELEDESSHSYHGFSTRAFEDTGCKPVIRKISARRAAEPASRSALSASSRVDRSKRRARRAASSTAPACTARSTPAANTGGSAGAPRRRRRSRRSRRERTRGCSRGTRSPRRSPAAPARGGRRGCEPRR